MRYLFFIVSFLVLISCTVTRRLHQPGYYVDWKTNSLRTIQVPQHTLVMNDETIANKSASSIVNNAQTTNKTTFSESDTVVVTTQSNSFSEETALSKKQHLHQNAVKVVKKMTKPLKKTIARMRSANNQYVGATRADLLLRNGLILLLVAAITIGIGLLFFIFGGEVGWIFGVILTLIGAGALIASILLLLFSLLVFLLFG